MSTSAPRLPLLIYRSLLAALTPYLRRRFARQGREQDIPLYAAQRSGRGYLAAAPSPVWFHAASVGEVVALQPLIEALRHAHPDRPLLLTTNTPSGGQIARQRLGERVNHAFLPMDWRPAVRRFLAHYRPRLGVVMETELWPHLYRQCAADNLPLLIVNGRVSRKTLAAPRWLRSLYRYCLQQCTAVLCRSEADRTGFLALGATVERCRTIGNIKFAAAAGEPPEAIELGRPYVLAASSRDGEEQLIAKAWQQSGRPELLVIAPRHPQRLDEILADLQPLGFGPGRGLAIRSRGEVPGTDTTLYIADTFGELRAFMAGAELVFMGGSLVAKGGHNILEPAALGKAVVTGPHMDNFADETATLLAANALRQVAGSDDLAEQFRQLLGDAALREALGARARATVTERQRVAQDYLKEVEAVLQTNA